ncbi:hypothetical protein H3Z28_002189 [Salmonella enterica subsp. enterica serovar Ank]|nr:hypothetical protein [Salmonella enterica subsp. enterica serovar Ank]EHY9925876.1 hypothetical protein [Salmonella enterica subsp. enterica serovar Ank]MJU51656.1 hypothetical protein [Salmonella enterica subsp. enterica serovar Coquilhatville]
MLENYSVLNDDQDTKKLNRLRAVDAALEIAKTAVGAATASGHCRTAEHLEAVAAQIESLADAIQAAIEK